MTAFTGKTGDIIKIRRDHDNDEGDDWIYFCTNDIDLYRDTPSRRDARDYKNFHPTHVPEPKRIAKVIKRTPCFVYAQVSK